MKQIKYILLALLLTGCEKLLIVNDPENNAVNNFEILWKAFKQHYYSFEMKGVNWDSVYTIYRPQVNESTSPKDLYYIIFNMTCLLKDVHVDIYQPYGPSGYDQTAGYPENSPKDAYKYIENSKTLTKFEYGKIKNYNIGYIRIPSFEGDVNIFNPSDENPDFKKIDDIVASMQNMNDIIIDVRSNEGGDDLCSMIVASRFADKKRIFEYQKYRKNENNNDYMTLTRYIEPKGNIYNKPVVVLTNRRTASAAEGFVEMMKTFPNITIMGGNTSGGAGGSTYFELPNGWTYRIVTRMSYDANRICYENIGIPPNVVVTISNNDAANGIDTILERAINFLK